MVAVIAMIQMAQDGHHADGHSPRSNARWVRPSPAQKDIRERKCYADERHGSKCRQQWGGAAA